MEGREAMEIGTESRPLRVAVIGSGPSGFYAADALLNVKDLTVHVDMYDRLPTPYGLVRGGVAPDHQSIKKVVKVYERSASSEHFRFYGNVELGRDIQVDELQRFYDQIVYAVGNEGDRRLGVPGEYSEFCAPSSVFVGWYNGHPDYRDAGFVLDAETVVVVGNGNVSADVTRLLACDADELRATDIADHALEALLASRVKHIIVLGRLGPVQVAYTPPELRELGKLHSADLEIPEAELELRPHSQSVLDAAEPNSSTRKNWEILQEYAARGVTGKPRRITFLFFRAVQEVIPDESNRIRAVRVAKMQYVPKGEGEWIEEPLEDGEIIEAQMMLTAIGFEGKPIPQVPFDPERKIISNVEGRVVTHPEGKRVPNQYVVGWAKSGPRGQIGLHKAASAEVAKLMLEDLVRGEVPERKLPPLGVVDEHLRGKGISFVEFEDWKILDEAETNRGERRGAPRIKYTDVGEMLSVMGIREAVERS